MKTKFIGDLKLSEIFKLFEDGVAIYIEDCGHWCQLVSPEDIVLEKNSLHIEDKEDKE